MRVIESQKGKKCGREANIRFSDISIISFLFLRSVIALHLVDSYQIS